MSGWRSCKAGYGAPMREAPVRGTCRAHDEAREFVGRAGAARARGLPTGRDVRPVSTGSRGAILGCRGSASISGGRARRCCASCPSPDAGRRAGESRQGAPDHRFASGELICSELAAARAVECDRDPVEPAHGRVPSALRAGVPGDSLSHVRLLRCPRSEAGEGSRRPPGFRPVPPAAAGTFGVVGPRVAGLGRQRPPTGGNSHGGIAEWLRAVLAANDRRPGCPGSEGVGDEIGRSPRRVAPAVSARGDRVLRCPRAGCGWAARRRGRGRER